MTNSVTKKFKQKLSNKIAFLFFIGWIIPAFLFSMILRARIRLNLENETARILESSRSLVENHLLESRSRLQASLKALKIQDRELAIELDHIPKEDLIISPEKKESISRILEKWKNQNNFSALFLLVEKERKFFDLISGKYLEERYFTFNNKPQGQTKFEKYLLHRSLLPLKSSAQKFFLFAEKPEKENYYFLDKILSITGVNLSLYRQGKCIFSTIFNLEPERLTDISLPQSLRDKKDFSLQRVNNKIENISYYSMYITLEKDAEIILGIHFEEEKISETWRFILKATAFWFLFSILLIYIISFALSFFITKPIIKITDLLPSIIKGKYNLKVPVQTGDEIGYLADTFNKMVLQLKEKEKMKFYLSKSARQAVEDETSEELKLGGHMERATVVFTDLRDFTSISEKFEPQLVLTILNRFFNQMVTIIERHGGIVDKFIGDSIMAIYYEEESTNSARNAVICALEMQGALRTLNEEFKQNYDIELKMGVGLSTGSLIAGNIGSLSQMSFTVIGNVVNLASRLEGESKKGASTRIIVDEQTKNAVEKIIHCREMENKKIKGMSTPVIMYELENIKLKEEILQLTESENPERIIDGLIAMGHSRNPEYLERILHFVKSENTEFRTSAIKSLSTMCHDFPDDYELQEKILEELWNTLESEQDPETRGILVKYLGRIGGEQAVIRLLPYLEDEHSRIRANVSELCELLSDRELIQKHLTPLLSDPSNRVRGNVAVVLWNNNYEEVVLKKLREMLHSKRWVERASAIYAFGEIGSLPATIQLVTNSIQDGKVINEKLTDHYREIINLTFIGLEDEHLNVVRQAIIAMGKMGERNSIVPIYRIINEKNYTRIKSSLIDCFEKIGISVQDLKTILQPFEK
ncbi:adenylate/guanylate cyclase domain-containing protein [Candidatus Riflebacteria bacterium]